MSVKVRLRDIARIQIGYQHRGRIAIPSGGTHRIIQIKDITAAGELQMDNLSLVKPLSPAERYQVNKGDLLFLSRGHHVFAIPVLQTLENTIAAYYFYIIRVSANAVLPEYLAWFINQEPAQRFLQRRMRGSHAKMVPKSAFAALAIDLPSVEVQETIVNLERLRRKEETFLTKLALARKQLIQELSLQAARARMQENRRRENG